MKVTVAKELLLAEGRQRLNGIVCLRENRGYSRVQNTDFLKRKQETRKQGPVLPDQFTVLRADSCMVEMPSGPADFPRGRAGKDGIAEVAGLDPQTCLAALRSDPEVLEVR